MNNKYNFWYDKFRNLPLDELNGSVYHACKEGGIDLIKYLLTSDELSRNAQLTDDCFSAACLYNHLNIIKYFLTSPDLEEHRDLHFHCNYTLIKAAKYGNLEIVKYLFNSPECKEYVDIHANNNTPFINALIGEQFEILNYFIVELNMEKTDRITEVLKKLPNEYIEKLFTARDLNKELGQELNTENTSTPKKNKI